MYDSRSDHPRGPETRWGKSKHGSSHPERNALRNNHGRAVFRRPDMDEIDALVDQTLGDLPDWSDTPGLKRMATNPYRWVLVCEGHGLALWECELLREIPCEETRWERARSVVDWDDDEDWDAAEPDEMLAGWEAECAGLPKETRWSDDGKQASVMPDAWASRVTEDDDYWPDSDDDGWLTTSPREFFDAVGEAWVIEGPCVTHSEPTRAGHYMRAWELAREVGIETRDLLTFLAKFGEFVKCAQSWVAMPVCKRVMTEADTLVAGYGARKVKQADPIDTLRQRLLGPRPTRRPGAPRLSDPPRPMIRPGVPRPGNNPFNQRSEHMDNLDKRMQAMEAARGERQRMAAQIDPKASAKVERPDEPAYDTSLDPISPDFNLASWGE